jgi:hypothetical protein
MSSVEPPKVSHRHLVKIGATGALLYHLHLPTARAEFGVLAPNAFIRVTAR